MIKHIRPHAAGVSRAVTARRARTSHAPWPATRARGAASGRPATAIQNRHPITHSHTDFEKSLVRCPRTP